MTHFGKYQVVEQIGEGGFGRIFKGYDPALKRTVAIKTCTLRGPDLRARFVREAEIAANLRHPNIVTVYDFGEQDGEPYLVQEYLPGDDLDALIKRGQSIAMATKIGYLIQAARGLAHAHANGVVHRDVKPANVRVQPDGVVRIMDFGIAKLLDADEQLTQVGMSLGTVGYLAPEQLRGQAIDHRADIFSFGALAYELVTHHKAFPGDDVTTIFYRIAHEEPQPIPALLADCPPSLVGCVERCLRKRPEERYSSLAGAVADLETALTEARGGAAATRATSPSEPVSAAAGAAPADARPARRGAGPRAWGLIAATAAVALFGIVNLTRWAGSAPTDASERLPESAAPADPAADPTPGDDGRPPNVAAGQPSGDSTVTAAGAANPPQTPAAPVATPRAGAGGPGGAGASQTAGSRTDGGGTGAPTRPQSAPPPRQEAVARDPAAATARDRSAAAAGDERAGNVRAATAAPASRVLVLLQGGQDAAGAAEVALIRELMDAGAEIIDAAGVDAETAARGPASSVGALGRRLGAGTVLVAQIAADAAPSVGAFFTGTATLTLRSYDPFTDRLLATETFQVGAGNVPGKLGSSAGAAATEAATEVGRRAGRAAARQITARR